MPPKKAAIPVLFVAFVAVLAGCSTNGVTPTPGNKIYFFYSPECPHCENVMPYVKNASKKIEIEFCQIEKMSNECKEIAKKIGLKGVPTAVYQKGGKTKIYIGEVKVKNLMLEILRE